MWETPQAFFDLVDYEFHFELDACAVPENAKCKDFITPEQDALTQDWGRGRTIWCNPPYGRGLTDWVVKARSAASQGNTVVMLLPARTDTKWFHRHVYHNAEIRFVEGRLKFGGSRENAPFPSMLAIFYPIREEDLY